MECNTVTFFVNGQKVDDKNIDPEWTLAWYLREKLRLTGCKIACEEGQCGSCTVVLGKFSKESGKPRYLAINACLMPVAQLHGCAITTTEGLGSSKTGMHPLQERMAKGHASQCGFCTPGFTMSMYALLRNNPEPSTQQIEAAVQGNLCRCTGYRPILETLQTFTKDTCCSAGGQCCKNKGAAPSNGFTCCQLTDWTACTPYNPSQDPIFPPELQMNHDKYATEYVKLTGPTTTFHRPTTLEKLCELMKQHQNAKLVGSGAWQAFVERYQPHQPVHVITTSGISELRKTSADDEGLKLGAGVTITEMQDIIEGLMGRLPEEKVGTLRAIQTGLNYFTSKQIKNLGTWAGNVGSGLPVLDLTVLFLGIKCKVVLLDAVSGQRRVVDVDGDFYTGSGSMINRKPSEIIVGCTIPFTSDCQFMWYTKHTTRRGYGSALVNLAAFVEFDAPNSDTVKDIRLAFGGMGSKPRLASATCTELIRKKFDKQLFETACSQLATEMKLPDGELRGKYRTALCLSLFFKFYQRAKQWTLKAPPMVAEPVLEPFKFGQNVQELAAMHKEQAPADPVGRPVPHQWTDRHTTGEAVYTGDERAGDMVHVAPVISEKPHAKLLSVNFDEAMKVPGVLTYITVKDIPSHGTNSPGSFMDEDETVFAVDKVNSMGQTIGAIVAEDSNIARQAAKLVKIQYEELPAVLNIQEAIKAQSFIGEPHVLTRGDPDKAMSESAHVISGTMKMEREWEIFCATQSKSEAHFTVAKLLGVPSSQITIRTKRVGGGFGGKLSIVSRALWPACIAAEKVKRPAKCVLTRAEDIRMTGKRHAAYAEFKVGCTNEGKINAVDIQLYIDAGYTTDQSFWVLGHAVDRLDNVYSLTNAKIIGRCCYTNTPSSTAFRGYGTPQGYFTMDKILDKIAETLKIPSQKVREVNFMRAGDPSLYGEPTVSDALFDTWVECQKISSYESKMKEIKEFNSQNAFKKRGIALIPNRFSLGMKDLFIEQGAALVHIYLDGSVTVHHGGVEMGQGINVKMLQIASRELNRPIETITIVEGATDKVPNAAITAGSQGTDVFGPATRNACRTLLERLAPLMKQNPEGTWEQWIQAAYFSRVHLSATGFAVPEAEAAIKTGSPRNYAYGTACTMVEVDCLTGDHHIVSTDLVIALPGTVNPAIDIGQIEGAFIQGYGLYTWEELKYNKKGQLVNDTLGSYKIPSVATMPRVLRTTIIKREDEKYSICGARGIGEVSFYCGSSGYWGIQDAVNAYRADHDLPPVHMESPATPEQVRMACEDMFTKAA